MSCKDFAKSGRSVTETDVGSVSDKVVQHRADGFLLATTTTASTGLKALLDSIHVNGKVETLVWDKHELESILLQEGHIELVKRYLPESYSVFQRLGSLPQALDSLQALVPGPVYSKIRDIVETYRVEETWLTGERIWPHDHASSRIIDRAIAALLEQRDASHAARILAEGVIEFDALEAVLKTLRSFRPIQTQELCRELVLAQDAGGLSLYAYRLYVTSFEPSNETQIALAVALASEDLHELYGDEVVAFVGEELVSDPGQFQAWSDLDALSSHTVLEEAYVFDVHFIAGAGKSRIDFKASVKILVTLSYDREGPDTSASFPGLVEGYIDADGMFIENVTVDVQSYYE